MTRLEEIQNTVAGHMDDIKSMFKAEAKITVLVRLPENPEADFLMTDDDLGEAVAALQRRQAAGADR